MSKNDCKPRFKGVENFLRRVAFNLGNTPSQTEVKVISCIPIDVTDLQHKIVQLEKQLEQQLANNKVNSTESPNSKETAICSCDKTSNAATSCKSISRQSSSLLHKQNCSTNQNRSNVSFICPTEPNQAHCFYSTEVSEITCIKKRKPIECRKIFFNKRKNPKKDKIKTQMVYYAHAEENNPFNKYFLADDGTSKKRSNEDSNNFNRSYLTDMFREQYRHGPVFEGTNLSELSTPICRDITHTPKVQPCASDMCSCCHGQFQNIDNHMGKHHLDIFSSKTDGKNAYYDANLYDVVPVKENSIKVKNFEYPKRKEPRHHMDIAFWPGNVRPRNKVSPMMVNYSTTPQARQLLRKVKHNRKEKELKKMSRKPTLYRHVNQETSTKYLNSRSVEFGEVYAKRIGRNSRNMLKPTPTKVNCNDAKNRNDAECLTTVIASTECQTSATITSLQEKNNEPVLNVALAEDKTKETLTQIKELLQSVLTEVKTNSKTVNMAGQTKKKDAVVQNGLSQSNIYGGSSLLHSFTYSPYNMDPYGPLCSQQRHPSSLCYPNLLPSSAKCMQHYPLFVQPGRNTCTSYYGNDPQVNKLPTIRRAASAATNTEDFHRRSKETETLIKEIYKAMALNIENPSVDTLVNEHGDKHQNYNIRPEDREARHIAKAVSEIFKNTNPIHSSVTQNTGTPFESKPTSNETSFRHPLPLNNAQLGSKETADVYNEVNTEMTHNDEKEQVSRELESDEESDVTIVNEVTESSASETESEENDDDVAIAFEEPCKDKEKEKKGLFSKMLKIFMPRSRNRMKIKTRKENQTSDNDSDDYNVHVYSHRPVKNTRSKSRAIIFYSKKPRNKSPALLPQRTPYMEQEYRRHFNEKLTFHDNQNTRSSSRESAPQKDQSTSRKLKQGVLW